MRPPGAVVFDCDGVLVDSEAHSVAAWMVVLGRLGHPAREGDVERCTGLGFAPTWAVLDAVAPLPPPEEVWASLLVALDERFTDPGLSVFADAVLVLDHCIDAGVPVAVVSASPRRRLDMTLGRAGLAGRFPVSVSGDDVTHGKPAPDGYATAAAALGVDPGRCVAVEDSPAGAASAVAAGMRVVAVVRREEDRVPLAAAGARVVDVLTPEAVGVGSGI